MKETAQQNYRKLTGTRFFIFLMRFMIALPFLLVAALSIMLWETITGNEFDFDL